MAAVTRPRERTIGRVGLELGGSPAQDASQLGNVEVAGGLVGGVLLLVADLVAQHVAANPVPVGLVTLVIGGLSAASLTSGALLDEVGAGAPLLIVLASLLAGALLGTALRLEDRLEGGADWVRRRVGAGGEAGT